MMTTKSFPLAVLAILSAGYGCSTLTTVAGTPAADAGAADAAPTPVTTMDAKATEDAAPPTDAGTAADPLAACTRDPGGTAAAFDAGAAEDPVGAANFTLVQALAGFPAGAGKLSALITTEKSSILCELAEKDAPITVANFVGLARGTRPYLDSQLNTWKTSHFYDGLVWHRVIPNFVIQGGDPLGNGTGGPGYDLPVENQKAEPLGTLAMAASDKPSGSQFYIVVGKGPAAKYNVFGKCSTEAAIEIAAVERNSNDAPKTPVHLQKVEIARCP